MNSDNKFREYHEYLRGRNWKGQIYVKRVLYPKICRYTKGKVLDVGCGSGDFLEYCSGAIGIDVNPYNVSYCKERGLTAIHTEGTKFPFKMGEFNSAVLDNILEHIEEPDGIIAETRRILTDDGILVAGVPGRKGFDHDKDHKRFYDEFLLDKVITKHGFKCIEKFYMPFLKSEWLARVMRQYCLYGVYIAG